MADPRKDPEARLKQVRDEIDDVLEGGEFEDVEGTALGGLDEIKAVTFAVATTDEAMIRHTQVPVTEPPAPSTKILGEMLYAYQDASGVPALQIATQAIKVMERSRQSAEYRRLGNIEEGDDGPQ